MVNELPRIQRDKRIYELNVIEGVTQRALASIYGVSRGRINQIVIAEKKKHLKEKYISLEDRIINEFDYLDSQYMDSTGRRASANVKHAVKTVFKYLIKLHGDVDIYEFYELLLDIDYDELIDIRNMGVKKVNLIKQIQDLIRRDYNYYRYKFLNNCKKVIACDNKLF